MALHLVDDGGTAVTGTGASLQPPITQDLLETAAYERSGPDLVLVSPDGERLTVKDYFSTPSPPDLHAANGAYLSGTTVSLLAGPAPVQMAQAGVSDVPGGAPRIGIVERLVGSATVQRLDGSQAQLKDGDAVFQGDVVKVSLDGKLGLSFLDKSVFSLSGGGTMTLNELIYNPDSSSNKMVFGLVNGSLSFVTGAVAPSGGVTVETPVAVMAIRGTIPIALDAGGGRYLILSDQGTFQVIPKLPGSEVLTIDDSGRAIYFPNGLAGAPTIIDLAGSGFEDEIAELIAQLTAARQDFLQRRAGGTGSPDFADFETFAWIEGEAILLQLSELLSPLLLETELASAEIEFDFETDDPSEAGGQEGESNAPPVIIEVDGEGNAIEDNTLTATGNIFFTDENEGDAYSVLAAATEPGYIGDFTATISGTVVTWNFAVTNEALQFLAEGQQLTQTYAVTIDDGNGGVAVQNITVTITGTNDAPVITSAPGSGAVEEDGTVSAAGTIAFTDVDLTDTQSVSFAPAASSYLGVFAAVLSGSEIAWTFDVDNADIQFLSLGDVLTQIYTVTITDNNGGVVTQDVTITITGANDGPVITSPAQSGAVAEDGIVSTGGSITFSDPDLGDAPSVTSSPALPGNFAAFSALSAAPAYLGTFSAVISGNQVLWEFNVDNADLQFLTDGEVLTQTYTVVIDDGNGGTAQQNVTITITGTNDDPVITSGPQNGAIEEDGTVSANGAITFSDADSADTHSVAFVPAGSGYLGSFAAVVSGNQVDWNFEVDNAALQFLAEGEVLTQTYTVTISDDGGDSVAQDVTITITGTNDAPVITSEAQDGAIQEDGTVSAGGTIDFTDADLADTHSATFAPAGTGYVGTFAAVVSGNQVDWSFDVNNAALQFLAKDEVLTQTYAVTVSDGNGGTAVQNVTVTITGTNDAPVITSEAGTGAVAEDGIVSTGGSIAFTDVDLADTQSVTSSPADLYYLGVFTAVVSGSQVDWTFSVDNADLQYLAPGEVLTQIYTVTIDDGNGGTDQQDVTITITGSNDAPVITSEAQSGEIQEDGTVSAGGAITFSDGDPADSHSVTFTPAASGYLGSFAAVVSGNQVDWSFNVDNASLQFLAEGEALTQTYTVTIDDGNGGTDQQDVTITITGTNDAPVITTEAQTGDIKEDGTVTAGGTIEFTDVDLSDSHSVSFAPADEYGFGSFGATIAAGEVSWTYTVSNSALQFLAEGETRTQVFTVTITDNQGGSDTQNVTITIEGTNDVPVIGGVASGTVGEDAILTTSGQLTIADVDAGESQFAPQPSFESLFGTFSIDADGNWTYALDNTDLQVQALEDGETLYDSFTVFSADLSTNHLIEITINGKSEPPDLPPPYTGDDDPNNYNDLGYAALYEPEVTYQGGYEGGSETWNGTDGNDTISAGENDDTVYGHGGEDMIAGNGGNDADLEGEYESYAYGLYGQYGDDTITGGAGLDHLYGGSGNDVLYGGTNPYTPIGATDQDVLYGGSGSDTLYGQDGNDDLIGGYGADILYGGSGRDDFIYLSELDTGDTIEDFDVGEDLVDLSALLGGNLLLGGQTTVVTANSFNWYQDGANTIVTADVTGDTTVDIAITLTGVDADTVTENSFTY